MAKENGYIGGLVTGILMGAVAALLLAPKKGDSVGQEMAAGAGALKEKAGDVGTGAIEMLGERLEAVREKLTNLRHSEIATDDQNVYELIAENPAEVSDAVADAVSDAVSDEVVDAIEDVQPNAADALAATTEDAAEIAHEIEDEITADVQPNADDAKSA